MTLKTQIQDTLKAVSIEYKTSIKLQGGFKPITLVKSHIDELSEETMEFLGQLYPISEANSSGFNSTQETVMEVPILISEHAGRGDTGSATTKLGRLEESVDSWADIHNRVYRSMCWAVRRWPAGFYANRRVIMMPYGNGLVTLMVGTTLRGMLGVDVQVLNMIWVDGKFIPNPKNPLVDISDSLYSGRKLRWVRDESLSNPTPVDVKSIGKYSDSGKLAKKTHDEVSQDLVQPTAQDFTEIAEDLETTNLTNTNDLAISAVTTLSELEVA